MSIINMFLLKHPFEYPFYPLRPSIHFRFKMSDPNSFGV